VTFDPQNFETGCLNRAWSKLVKRLKVEGFLQQFRPFQHSSPPADFRHTFICLRA